MKNPDRNTVSRTDELLNIGKAIAQDLQLIGIDHPKKLIQTSPISQEIAHFFGHFSLF